MPTSTDLMGLGLPSSLSAVLGNQPTSLTCAGTSQATATATILSHNVDLTAAGGADSCLLPSGALIGTPYWIFNSSATTAKIFVPSGHTLNTTLNAGLSVATHLGAIMIQYKRLFWMSILTA